MALALENISAPPPPIPINRAKNNNASQASGGAQIIRLEGRGFKAGAPIPETTLTTQGKEIAIKGRESAFSPELHADFTNYMQGYLTRMIRLSETLPQDQFNALLQNEYHLHDAMIFEEFVDIQHGANGRNRKLNVLKLQEAMKTDRFMGIAYAIRMNQTITESLSAGIRMAMDPESSNPDIIEEESIKTGRGGPLREAFRKIRQMAHHPINSVYGRRSNVGVDLQNVGDGVRQVLLAAGLAASTALNASGGDPTAALVAGLIPPAIAGIVAASARGERLNIVQCVQALRSITSVPEATPVGTPVSPNRRPLMEEVRWQQEFSAIDPFDIEIIGNEARMKEGGRVAGTRISNEELRDRLVGNTNALMQFQEAIGVPRSRRQAMDISFIYDGTGQPPQQGTDLEQRVLRYFNPNREGKRNTAGQTPEREVPPGSGNWQLNPDFRANPLDMEGNAERWRSAFRRALREEIQGAMQEVIDNKTNYEQQLLNEIQGKKDAQGPTGERTRARKAAIEREEAQLTMDDEAITKEITPLTTYENRIEMLDEKIEEQESLERQVGFTPVPGTITTAEQALTQILVDTTPVPPAGAPATTPSPYRIVMDGREILAIPVQMALIEKKIQDEVDTFETTLRARLTAREDPTQRIINYEKRVRERYENVIKNIEKQETRVRNLLTQIQEARDKKGGISDTKKLLLPRDSDTRTALTSLSGMTQAHAEINGLTPPGHAQLSNVALRTESFDELMRRINTANTIAANLGWPPTENNNPGRRLALLQAMAEARAIGIEPRILTPSTDFITATTTMGLTENELTSLSTPELVNRLTTLGHPIPPATTLDNVRTEARSRLTARREGLEEVKRNVEARKRTVTAEKVQVEKGLPTPELDVIESIAKRYGKIRAEVQTINLAELLRETPAVDPNVFIPAENVDSEAYVRMMNLMFDHFHDESSGGRGAAFERNKRVVPPDELRQALINYFDLTITYPPTPPAGAWPGTPARTVPCTNWPDALRALRNRFGLTTPGQPPSLSRGQFAQFFTEHMIFQQLAPRVATY